MVNPIRSFVAVLIVGAAACGRGADVEKVPVGTEVQVTRQDGAVVQGRLADRDSQAVRIQDGTVTRTVARSDVADVRLVDRSRPPVLPAAAKFREVTVPVDTMLPVALLNAVASDVSRVEDPVEAAVAEPVRIGDLEAIPAGARVHGVVTAVKPAGRVKGRASIAVRFDMLVIGDDRYAMKADVEELAPATKADDARKVAVPAGAGAIIGAIIGGSKGAAVGGAIGAGGGAAVVLATAGEEIRWPAGLVLKIPLAQGLDVKVWLRR